MSLSITITILLTSHRPISLIHRAAIAIAIVGEDDRGNVDISAEVIAIMIDAVGDGAAVGAGAGVAFFAGGGAVACVGDFSAVNVG